MPQSPFGDADLLSREMRDQARQILQRTLKGASIEKAFERHVHCEHGVLRVCEDLYDLNSYSRIFGVAIGKAAHPMVEALAPAVGGSLEGIVATPVQPQSQVRGFRYFHGGHPTPNAESIVAGEAILKSVAAQNASALLLFLITGGGSSVVDKPIDNEISLPDLVATYRTLVLSGAPIAEINAIRKHLSAIKGGRLAKAAYPAHQISLLISDVPDNAPDALASGPTMPDSTTVQDCYAIADKYGLLPQFPAAVSKLFHRRALQETPKSGHPAFHRSRWWTLLSNKSAVDEAGMAATSLGFAVEVDNTCDDWEYDRAAQYLLSRVRHLRQQVSRVCLLSGGEVTVKVTDGGIGGRNQQFALACAQKIAGESITVLSAGTDGIDGNSPADGAVADGTTLERAKSKGRDPAAALARFDAYNFFDALGDTIVTGPTGNNLRDLRVLLAY